MSQYKNGRFRALRWVTAFVPRFSRGFLRSVMRGAFSHLGFSVLSVFEPIVD
jgi:hypothetical protein